MKLELFGIGEQLKPPNSDKQVSDNDKYFDEMKKIRDQGLPEHLECFLKLFLEKRPREGVDHSKELKQLFLDEGLQHTDYLAVYILIKIHKRLQ